MGHLHFSCGSLFSNACVCHCYPKLFHYLQLILFLMIRRSVSICPPNDDKEQKYVAISNALFGLDIYSLISGEPQATYRDKHNHNACPISSQEYLPVLYIHNGVCLLGGSHVGRAHIWEVGSDSANSVLCTLRHKGILIFNLNYFYTH